MKTLSSRPEAAIEILEARIAPAALNFANTFPGLDINDLGSSVSDIVAVSDGVVVVGTFNGTVDFDPGAGAVTKTAVAPVGSTDVFIAKYSDTGALQWGTQFGGATGETAAGVVADDSGNIIVAGGFFGTVKINGTGTGVIASGTLPDFFTDAYVLKLNGATGAADSGFGTGGIMHWGGEKNDVALGLTYSNNSVFVTGSFRSPDAGFNATGSVGLVGGTAEDAFVFKLQTGSGAADTGFGGDGVVTFGGTSTDIAYSVAVGSGGTVYLAGGFRSSNAGVDALGINTANSEDAFVLRLTSSGTLDTTFAANGYARFGGSADDSADRVMVDSVGRAVIAGTFAGADALLTDSATTYSSDASGGNVDAFLLRYTAAGSLDTSFDTDAFVRITSTSNEQAHTLDLAFDPADNVLFTLSAGAGNLGINSHTNNLLGAGGLRVAVKLKGTDGTADTSFNSIGLLSVGNNANQLFNPLPVAYGSASKYYFGGSFVGTVDFDPYTGTANQTSSNSGTALEGYILSLNPSTPLTPIDRTHPLDLVDANGEHVTVTLSGDGYAEYTLVGGVATMADIDAITFFNTNDTTVFTVKMADDNAVGTTIRSIKTSGVKQDIGIISLKDRVVFGSGANDAITDLLVTGVTGQLDLFDVQSYTSIRLGIGLSFAEVADNHPSVFINDVLGPGVSLLATDTDNDTNSDGGDFGGGGFVLNVHSWGFAGLIGATETSSVHVESGDLAATIEVDRYHVSFDATSSLSRLAIDDGNLASAGNIVRGKIGDFSALGVTASATLEAASLRTMTIEKVLSVPGSGDFNGTLLLTSQTPDSTTALVSATIEGDFTGGIHSTSVITQFNVGHNFRGSLLGESIGAITAASFDGDNTGIGGEKAVGYGDEDINNIIAMDGDLPVLKPKTGVIKNYEIIAAKGSFGGFVVKPDHAVGAGVDEVLVIAQSIGDLTVTLPALAGHTVIEGINNSEFHTTGTGTTKDTLGSIGKVTVTIPAIPGATATYGLSTVILDAWVQPNEFMNLIDVHGGSTLNRIGNIAINVTGTTGELIGLDGVTVHADQIGSITINAKSTNTTTAFNQGGIVDSTIFAHAPGLTAPLSATIGKITIALTGTGADGNDRVQTGIENSVITADQGNGLASIADVNVTIKGASGEAHGIIGSTFTSDKLSKFTVSVAGGDFLDEASGINNSTLVANGLTVSGANAASIGQMKIGVTGGSLLENAKGLVDTFISSATSSIAGFDIDVTAGGQDASISGYKHNVLSAATSVGNLSVDVTAKASNVTRVEGLIDSQLTAGIIGKAKLTKFTPITYLDAITGTTGSEDASDILIRLI